MGEVSAASVHARSWDINYSLSKQNCFFLLLCLGVKSGVTISPQSRAIRVAPFSRRKVGCCSSTSHDLCPLPCPGSSGVDPNPAAPSGVPLGPAGPSLPGCWASPRRDEADDTGHLGSAVPVAALQQNAQTCCISASAAGKARGGDNAGRIHPLRPGWLLAP